VVPGCLLDVNDDVVIESALCAGGLMGGQGWLRLEAEHGVGVALALGLGEVRPGVVRASRSGVICWGEDFSPFLAPDCSFQRAVPLGVLGQPFPKLGEGGLGQLIDRVRRIRLRHREASEGRGEESWLQNHFGIRSALQFTSLLPWTGERQVLYICQSEIFPVHYFAISTMNACSIEL